MEIINKITNIFFLIFFVPSLSLGITLSPGEVKVKTNEYKAGVLSIPTGTYYYDISWQNIPVAKSAIEVMEYKIKDKEYYLVKIKVSTSSVIRWIYRLDHISKSLFEKSKFKPFYFSSLDKERRKERFRKMIYNEDGTVHSQYLKNKKLKQVYDFSPNNYMLDPISAAFMAKSVKFKVGMDINVDVFNAKERYLINFHIDKLEKIKINGVENNAYKITPKISKLMNKGGKKKFKEASIWILDNPSRRILKLESKVWIGSVGAVFDKFIPSEKKNKEISPEILKDLPYLTG